jgi:NADPH2:quinone reductase
VQQRPISAPAAGMVRVAVAFCGLNPLDVMVRSGNLAWPGLSWPLVLGIEHSGVVDAVGPDVAPSWLGARVLCRSSFGGYADHAIHPVSALRRLPASISLRDGAVFSGAGQTAWRILFERAPIQRGQAVLVHSAAGAVGAMLVQLAKRAGAHVIGAVGSPGKVDFVRALRADEVIVIGDDLHWAATHRARLPAKGIDLVIDGVCGPMSAGNLEVLADNGTIVVMGALSGAGHAPATDAFLITKNATVAGFNLLLAEHCGRASSELDQELAQLIAAGELRVPVTQVLPLESVPAAHQQFEARLLTGRTVIEVGGSATDRAANQARGGENDD